MSSGADRSAFRRLLLSKKPPKISPNPPEDKPLIPSSKKKTLASAALRGLGCASAASSEAFSPDAAAAVRSSADWQGKRPSRRRRKKKKERRSHAAAAGGGGCAGGDDVADVWCGPGVVFGAEASVDCVVSRREMAGRGRNDRERVHRERACITRRSGIEERISSLIDYSACSVEMPLFGSDPLPAGHLHYMRGYHRSPADFEEMLMFQTRILLGGMDVYDQYQDLRLDVDSMTYEDLLELGEKIGHVSTGLREEDIFRNLRKTKHSFFTASPLQKELKCIICLEEYDVNDEMGRLECGHSYHIYCIKQWLLRKNACPVCKTAITKS